MQKESARAADEWCVIEQRWTLIPLAESEGKERRAGQGANGEGIGMGITRRVCTRGESGDVI